MLRFFYCITVLINAHFKIITSHLKININFSFYFYAYFYASPLAALRTHMVISYVIIRALIVGISQILDYFPCSVCSICHIYRVMYLLVCSNLNLSGTMGLVVGNEKE